MMLGWHTVVDTSTASHGAFPHKDDLLSKAAAGLDQS